ncbi:MAG: hypothetical protein WCK70_05995 [Chloroflexales bacterium]
MACLEEDFKRRATILWLLADGPSPTLPLGNPQALAHAPSVFAVGSLSGLHGPKPGFVTLGATFRELFHHVWA